jgi:hypothetical protein
MKRKAAYAGLVSAVFVLVFATVTLADDNGAKGPVIPRLTPAPTFSDSTVPPTREES